MYREAKQHCNPKSLEESIAGIGKLKSVRCNCNGTKVSIMCDKVRQSLWTSPHPNLFYSLRIRSVFILHTDTWALGKMTWGWDFENIIVCGLKICKYNTIIRFKLKLKFFLSLNGKTSQTAIKTAPAVCSLLITFQPKIGRKIRIFSLGWKNSILI